MNLDFARSLSRVRVLRHEACVSEVATTPPLLSQAKTSMATGSSHP